ncbi:type II Golgi membrane protein [Spathaspora passalidarum NRRL Y-27907]|uniref:Type II Golgi membrane protein n=1 Tax=Spathaspora passalidarum (strain NRRL Y-27907 / 11-Y1) TaxID=619300 RepID=G3APX0_SPAPN|nr:type II Golgi membrane protein [Spathaspora passalidarum NRRL Y-27907]EGW32290.1 type II Golgi membrane protein [Spathaspora passalidarum NRRL Y-27907]
MSKASLQRMPRSISRLVIILIFIAFFIFYPSYNVTSTSQSPASWSLVNDDTAEKEQLQQEMQLSKLLQDEVDVEMEQISTNVNEEDDEASEITSSAHAFWKRIFNIFDQNKIVISGDISQAIVYTEKDRQKQGAATREALLSRASIHLAVMEELIEKHSSISKQLPSKIAQSTYKKNSKGVVLIGGTKFSWLSYLAIVALRETGSKLPVELIMPTKNDFERETELCTKLLPPLQATCVVVPDVLGKAVMKEHAFSKYQFKALALMVSSFEHILMLDSDNIIVSNPDPIFESKLYQYYGMITWPDYWKRTISPKFYEIAELEVNQQKRVRYGRFPLYTPPNVKSNLMNAEEEQVPYHDLEGAIADLSTESGQLIINKRNHGKTLLLALFYNIYGPDLFYKLFALGEQGEGDKDTFVAAALVSGQPYYQLKSFIKTFGYLDDDNNFQGVAMGQKNPIVDYQLFQDLIVKPFSEDEIRDLSIQDQIARLEKLENEQFHNNNDNPLFTIHCNYPKLDPLQYMERDDLYDKSNKKLKHRLYGGLTYQKYITNKDGNRVMATVDFEYEQWTHMQDILCIQKLDFVHFKDANMEELCELIKNQVEVLAL